MVSIQILRPKFLPPLHRCFAYRLVIRKFRFYMAFKGIISLYKDQLYVVTQLLPHYFWPGFWLMNISLFQSISIFVNVLSVRMLHCRCLLVLRPGRNSNSILGKLLLSVWMTGTAVFWLIGLGRLLVNRYKSRILVMQDRNNRVRCDTRLFAWIRKPLLSVWITPPAPAIQVWSIIPEVHRE